jgi:transcriptional regulator with XRE-family HTH domain
MIKNERQYKITKSQLSKFEEALIEMIKAKNIANQEDLLLRQVQVEALQSQVDELKEVIQDYEALITKPIIHELNSIESLPLILIKARIAAKLTQKELANQLGLTEQQIQRYEATNYSSASLSRIIEVSQKLDIKLKPPKTRKRFKSLTCSTSFIKLHVARVQKDSSKEPKLQ